MAEALDRAGDVRRPGRPSVARPARAGRPHHRLRPASTARAPWPRREPARRRLAFDELFRLQLALVMRQARLQRDARGIRHVVVPGPVTTARPWWPRSSTGLPFPLTAAQRRAMAEIRADLAGPLPMHRLLQGDVGLGQDGGGGGRPAGRRRRAVTRARSMAPTEVLAEQHAPEVRDAARGPDRPRPGDPRGPAPAAGRAAHQPDRRGRAEPASTPGWPTARSTSSSAPTPCSPTRWRSRSLGVVVIDEQHRFGVEQRATLRAKGRARTARGATPTCWS